MSRLKVGILGATGVVGQRMIQLLDRHPWFEVSVVAASDNSAGKSYAQAARWLLETPIPEPIVGPVQPCAVLDYKFRLLSHNTLRGAAGAAILNAELMYRKGLLGAQ